MNNDNNRVTAIHVVLAVLLGFSLISASACTGRSSTKAGIEINGTVTDYRNNVPAKDIEVKLYTYHPEPVLEYLPPTGHILNTDITDEDGKYKFEVDSDLLMKLEKQGYSKLVVYVAPGLSGFKVIDLVDGTRIVVDVVTGAPAPSAAH
jgi:hypothetical protein